MWTIIIPLIAGYVLASKKPEFLAIFPMKVLTGLSLILLLTVMGARIGADPVVMGQITTLGFQATALAMATILGSVLVLYFMQFFIAAKIEPNISLPAQESAESGSGYSLTLMLLFSVAGGIGLGLTILPPSALPILTTMTTWVLGLLLLGIGLDLGQSAGVFLSLKQLGFRILLLPLAIALGSIAGAVILVAFWDILAWNEAAALASGFGWYSLSSVLLSELHSPLLGALAFAANVIRELIAIIITPILAKTLGPLPAMGPAGATAMDVLLPVISRSTGKEYVPLAFFSGAVLSLAVAFLVQIFIGLS